MSLDAATSPSTRLKTLSAESHEAYSLLASEYYDTTRHPTCANFAAIQDGLLESLRPFACGQGNYLEVGCGEGRLDRLVGDKSLTMTDLCEPMLALARKRTSARVNTQRMDAFNLECRSASIRSVFAFLVDPYNELRFFQESHRVLCVGGFLVFTVPNRDWATALRSLVKIEFDQTEFFHRNGAAVRAPSITRPVKDQCELLVAAGFRVLTALTVSLGVSSKVVPSHHVRMAAEYLGTSIDSTPLIDV